MEQLILRHILADRFQVQIRSVGAQDHGEDHDESDPAFFPSRHLFVTDLVVNQHGNDDTGEGNATSACKVSQFFK